MAVINKNILNVVKLAARSSITDGDRNVACSDERHMDVLETVFFFRFYVLFLGWCLFQSCGGLKNIKQVAVST